MLNADGSEENLTQPLLADRIEAGLPGAVQETSRQQLFSVGGKGV